MPLLAGIFARKNKGNKRDAHLESITSSEVGSALSSPSADYVMPDKPLPSHPNAASLLHTNYTPPKGQPNNVYPSTVAPAPSSSSSTSKLRLAFTRKKSSVAVSPNGQSNDTSPPRPSYFGRGSTSTAPDEDTSSFRRLRPPPSRSAIFASYNDSNGSLSTRSLPNDSALPVPTPASNTPRRPSFFHWSKTSSNSTPPQSRLAPPPTSPPSSSPTRELPPLLPSDSKESFNLKSFRHVIPPSPARSNDGSNVSLNTPPPRPRGASVNSDSSQRISVAAFREAQARRSTAGSPVPSPRSPSPGPPNFPQASPLGADLHPGRNTPRPSRSSPHIARPRSSIAYDQTSDSEDSSSGGEDSEDETLRARPATTIRPGKARAKSEMGHGQSSSSHRQNIPVPPGPHRAPQSHLGHASPSLPAASNTSKPLHDPSKGTPEANQTGLPPRAQSSLGHNHPTRQRASVSTSAVSPSGDARRASMVASPPLPVHVPRRDNNAPPSSPPPVSMSVEERTKLNTAFNRSMTNVARTSKALSSSSSDSDSEDDAPLARLVGPRRPGSALSSHSNAGSRSGASVHSRPAPPKPLIDINQLTNSKPQVGPPKKMDGFTPGATLLSDPKLASSPRSPLSEPPLMTDKASPSSSSFATPLTSTVAPVKFVSPPSSPPKETRPFLVPSPEPQKPTPVADVAPAENRRAALNDRLTRAVKRSLSPGDRVSTDAAAKSPLSRAAELPPTLQDTVPPVISSTADRGAPKARKTAALAPLNSNRLSVAATTDPSPPDQDLAQLLGAAAKFISMNGDGPVDASSSSESDSSDSEDSIKEASTAPPDSAGIAPIPIKKRSPPPAFAVTSRPPFPKRDNTAPLPTSFASSSSTTTDSVKSFTSTTPRQRSSTLVPSSTSSTIFGPSKSSTPSFPSTIPNTSKATPSSSFNTPTLGSSSDSMPPKRSEASSSSNAGNLPAVRQRSSTMVTNSMSPPVVQQPKLFPAAPDRPFIAARRNSPASSTGDSSSGRAPLTPRDGSDIGPSDGRKREEWSSGVSGLGVKNHHAKRRSVSFEDDIQDLKSTNAPASRGRDVSRSKEVSKASTSASTNSDSKGGADPVEQRRRERRRSEAKAAIELGNVINGPGPVLTDDDDTDLPANPALNNPRMSTMNMGGMGTMPMGGFPGMPGANPWMNPSMQAPQMLSPTQFMIPPPGTADPQFLAAHQHAMMVAKQAYQMAVAQQAMAAAADEWERGSTMGGFGGGGSVYGGSTVGGPTMSSPFGMMPMMAGPGGWGATSSVYLANPIRSMYGGMMPGADMMSSSRSDYGGFSGGGRGANNWSSSRSTYGDSFGPSNDQQARKGPGVGPRRPALSSAGRDSGYFPSPPPIPASQMQNGRSSPDMRGSTPRSRTTSQPAASSSRNLATPRNAPPPSSWKPGM